MKLFAVIGIWSRKISAVKEPRDVSKVAVGFAMAEAYHDRDRSRSTGVVDRERDHRDELLAFWVLDVRHDELVHGELRFLEPRECIARGGVEILVRQRANAAAGPAKCLGHERAVKHQADDGLGAAELLLVRGDELTRRLLM